LEEVSVERENWRITVLDRDGLIPRFIATSPAPGCPCHASLPNLSETEIFQIDQFSCIIFTVKFFSFFHKPISKIIRQIWLYYKDLNDIRISYEPLLLGTIFAEIQGNVIILTFIKPGVIYFQLYCTSVIDVKVKER
jgi:hypothetical protein